MAKDALGAHAQDELGISKVNGAPDPGCPDIRRDVRRAGLDQAKVDGVVMGNVTQAGNKMNPARQAAIHGGVPVNAPAMTVNRVCGSGAQAIGSAAQDIWLGLAKVMIAGGMENMDIAPYLMGNGRWGYRMGDAQIYDAMLRDGLNDAFSDQHSGWHTEDLVETYQISREDQDRWAERSQRRFSDARAANSFESEIVAVEIKGRKGVESFVKDEHYRTETTLESLSRLKPAFRKEGTITAGNAPGLNSGAAAMIVADRAFAEANGLEPAARLVAFGIGASSPACSASGLCLRCARRSIAQAGRLRMWIASKSTRLLQRLPPF
jgi:acetyl-CoA C-acetyltransferase